MTKIPEDSPTQVGDRIVKRGSPRKGVIAGLFGRPGWMHTVWDDGVDKPKICHQSELQKID